MEGLIPHVVRPLKASTGLTLMLIGSNACSAYGGMIIFRLLLLGVNCMCLPARTVERSIIWTLGNFITFSWGADSGLIFSMLMVCWDTGRYPECLENYLDVLEYKIYVGRITMKNFRLFGYNSESRFECVVDAAVGFFNSFLDLVEFTRETVVNFGLSGADIVYLRDLQTRGALHDRTEDLVEPASDIIPKAKGYIELTATIWALMCIAGVVMIAVATNLLVVMMVVGVVYMCCVTPISQFSVGKPLPVKDGIYRVTVYMFGVARDTGIGTCHDGILYIPYHVIGTVPIQYQGEQYKASHIDQESDIATWNGAPQFETNPDIDKVIIVAQRDGGSTAYISRTNWFGKDMSFLSVTEPGESGSPVWAWNPELKHEKLVSLAGRYVGTHLGHKTEFHITPSNNLANPVKISTVDDGEIIAVHPGAGKTRRMIPELVHRITSEKNQNVIVTGPTRVVCREILTALKAAGVHQIASYIGGHTVGIPRARVAVMAHATMMKFILGGGLDMKRYNNVIIDESHMRDPATLFITEYCRAGLKQGNRFWKFSATHPGRHDSGSNYSIEDIQITAKEVAATLKQEIEDNKSRVVVFCGSINGKEGTDAMCKKYQQYNPINLNSKTYSQVARDLGNLDKRLIITTNIAECGINLNVDVVIDLGRNFKYFWESGGVRGRSTITTLASQVQRRAELRSL